MIDRRQRERQWQQPPLKPWIPLDDVEDGLYLEDNYNEQVGFSRIDEREKAGFQNPVKVAQNGAQAIPITPEQSVSIPDPLNAQTLGLMKKAGILGLAAEMGWGLGEIAGKHFIEDDGVSAKKISEKIYPQVEPFSPEGLAIGQHLGFPGLGKQGHIDAANGLLSVKAGQPVDFRTMLPQELNELTHRPWPSLEVIQGNIQQLKSAKQNTTQAKINPTGQFPPDPEECRQLENQMQRILFSNKRFPGSNTGDLGLLYRRAEQICGQHGPNDIPPGVDPDRTPWINHSEEIQRRQGNLAKVYKRYYEDLFCPNSEKRIDRNQIHRMQRKEFNPSPEEWLGPNHPNCKELPELLRNNSNPTLPRFFNDF